LKYFIFYSHSYNFQPNPARINAPNNFSSGQIKSRVAYFSAAEEYKNQGQYSQRFILLITTKGPNKLEQYIILGLKDLQGTNAPAFWTYSYVPKVIK